MEKKKPGLVGRVLAGWTFGFFLGGAMILLGGWLFSMGIGMIGIPFIVVGALVVVTMPFAFAGMRSESQAVQAEDRPPRTASVKLPKAARIAVWIALSMSGIAFFAWLYIETSKH